jgi:E3 ubiquitin-protein ligase RNF13/E3 ubiquitin-protein ligase RNF167
VGSDVPSGGWLSPAITFITILLLPSFLTFITLVIHRFRLVRAARRERAPEDIVRSLPWRVWTANGWEKHLGSELPPTDNAPIRDVESGRTSDLGERTPETNRASSSAPVAPRRPSSSEGPSHPWAETQTECAICLSEFEVGDRVRVLPCDHIFHLDEVDGWLIHNKKLCPVCKADVTQPPAAYVPSGERERGRDPEDQVFEQPTEVTPLLGSR